MWALRLGGATVWALLLGKVTGQGTWMGVPLICTPYLVGVGGCALVRRDPSLGLPLAMLCNWSGLLAGFSAWARPCLAIRQGCRLGSTARVEEQDRYHMLLSEATHGHCSGSLVMWGQACSTVG